MLGWDERLCLYKAIGRFKGAPELGSMGTKRIFTGTSSIIGYCGAF
jgi:hypothetical protein